MSLTRVRVGVESGTRDRGQRHGDRDRGQGQGTGTHCMELGGFDSPTQKVDFWLLYSIDVHPGDLT